MGNRINNHLTNLLSSQLSSLSHLLLVTWHLEQREEHLPLPHHAVASFSPPPPSTSPVFAVPVAVTAVSPLPPPPLPRRLPLPSLLFCPSDHLSVRPAVSPPASDRQSVRPENRQSVCSPSVRQSVRSPSVRQSVSPSVRQSASPSVRQSVSLSVRTPVCP